MRRFTIRPDRIDGEHVTFDRDETRHLARVLRLRPGDVVIAADGAGHDYTVRIDGLGDAASGTVLGVSTRAAESRLAVTLVHGIPKGDKMEAIIRSATELGVVRLVPVTTERTVVRLDDVRAGARTRRWQRIAKEAAKQCGRAVIPAIGDPQPLRECLAELEATELRLCLWERETRGLGEALASVTIVPRSAGVLVGPEGGLSADEVATAREAGWTAVGLGPRILRTETAGLAVVAILQARFGDLSA